MTKINTSIAALTLLAMAACNEDEGDSNKAAGGNASLYAVGSMVFADQGSSGYVAFLESLEHDALRLELGDAQEFGGAADLWVRDGFLYVSGGDAPTITKYSVGADRKLNEEGKVNFGSYGVTDTAFWNVTFVSSEKAYMVSGPTELVAWSPKTMRISGTVALPELEKRGALVQRLGTADRTSVVHDGKVYQTIYWSDENYADRAGDSVIIVIDATSDEVTDQIPVDCPALDYGTIDDDGMIHFSNWTGGVGTYYVLGTAQNCIAMLNPKTLDVKRTFFADIADGHEGSAFAYAGDGRFLMSVFDEERADAANADEPFGILGELNWQLWIYDSKSKSSMPVQGVDWNSGASIHTRIGDTTYSMIPGKGYATTKAYKIEGNTASQVYDVTGWSFRLFPVR